MPPSERSASRPSPPREVRVFAPGRVNLIGEHTDYNGGLALPFAIAEGVTVRAWLTSEPRILAHALDLDEQDEFSLATLGSEHAGGAPRDGWRAFLRGIAAELHAAGVAVPGAELQIHGEIPRGAGLSSSAALEVALALALLGLADTELDPRTLALLCSRVENDWIGAHTGTLDQLASLLGEPDTALRIDFSSLEITPVPLVLEGGWMMVTLDSGESHELAKSGYNARRAECARACELLGVDSLRELEQTTSRPLDAISLLPETLARRARHVICENERVAATLAALFDNDLPRVGALLDASHTSLREQYECSTPAVEATVARLKQAGAIGARMVGGGFGGSVLGLLPPGSRIPPGSHEVRPSRGAHVLE